MAAAMTLSTCACRKFDPHISVMQSAKDRAAEYATNRLDRALRRRVRQPLQARDRAHDQNDRSDCHRPAARGFIDRLRREGHAVAQDWLAHWPDVGCYPDDAA